MARKPGSNLRVYLYSLHQNLSPNVYQKVYWVYNLAELVSYET